jgi:outer membrane receptor protein involved in Fe transport
MKYMISLLLLMSHPWPGFAGQASGRVHGVTRDVLGQPLGGVEIALLGPSDMPMVTTREDGAYEFAGLAAGSYRLRATKAGYRETIQEITLEAGSSLAVNVEMAVSYAETVVVTASRSPESLLTAPASVAVLGSREIEASAAETFADLLREVPGLNIAQLGARDVEINPRSSTGILSNSMLVMIDGRSLVQPFYGTVYWDLMTTNKDEIAQIEVLRTPASALWGANALSGVINILTKSPRQVPGLRANLGFGERGTLTAGVTWADSTDRLSYKLSASYFEQDPWDRDNLLPNGAPMPPAVVFENRGAKQPKFDARIDWDGDARHVWSLRGGVAGAYGLQHSALGPGEFASGSYASYLELDRTAGDTDFKVYWNRFDAPFRIVLYGLDENAVTNTFASEITHRQKVGDRQQFVYGGSARLDQFDVTIAPADRHRFDAGAFVEDRIRINAALNATAGGRVDKFDTTDAVFSPRVGLVFTPKPSSSVRVAYNRAYRAPSLLENFVDVTLPAVVPLDPPFYYSQLAVGSTDLKMEKQDAVEVGYTIVLDRRTTLFVTLYQQSITNNIWFLPVSFYGPGDPPPGWPFGPNFVPLLPRAFSFVNLGRLRDRGVELTTKVEWPRLSVQGSYTYAADPLLESGTDLPLQINRPARHQGGGGLTYAATRWTASGDIHYTSRAFWADVFTEPFWGYTDGYVNANARASYHLAGQPWELWLSGTNLLDQKIKSHVYGDIVRRKISAGVRWELGTR